MKESAYVGVDPGMNGALAVLAVDGAVISCIQLPILSAGVRGRSELDAGHLLKNLQVLQADWDIVVCAVEHQQPFPGQGVVAVGTLMLNYGQILGMIACLGWSLVKPIPTRWKGDLGLVVPDSLKAASRKASAELREASAEGKAEAKKVAAKAKLASRKASKSAAVSYARSCFPSVDLYMGSKNPHDGMADALCIAQWARKFH